MKKLISILFFTIVQVNTWAQPAPCSGVGLDIVENIQNIDFDNTEIFIRSIQLKTNSENYYKWSDIHVNNTIDTNKLILKTLKLFENCSSIIYKSELHNRFYYSGSAINEVLIIQNGKRKMYLVFPTFNRIESEYFLETTVDSINKLNIQKGKNAYYHPNRYISNIEFREGVFFIKDYDNKFGVKSFYKDDITEFFLDNNIYNHKNPIDYWNNEISFISMFDEKNKLEYAKVFPGNYTENQAIELIVKNYPPIIEKILESSICDVKNKGYRAQHQKDLFEIWDHLLKANIRQKEFELFKKYQFKEISIDDAYKEYKNFLKTEFFSILASDFDLTLRYNKYFINENEDLKPFKKFIQKNGLKFFKVTLKFFIENIKNYKEII